nr:DUF6320 domain-containing protein [Maliibacterium massiliense]
MKYCEKCNVHVSGGRVLCPLCQTPLKDDGGPVCEAFPAVRTIYRQYHLFFRILIFASILASVAAVLVNLLLPQSGAWSLFVVGGLLCVWLSLAVGVRKRRNIPKNMLYQVVVIGLLAVAWDGMTGWRGWSLDYVVPGLCVCAMATLAILAPIMHWHVQDLILYLLLLALFCVAPLVFWLAGLLRVLYPTLICMACSVVSLAALVTFAGGSVFQELKRRLHL